MKDLVWSGEQFTIPEIRIVSPKVVICLGLRTFRALARAAKCERPRNMEQAIALPFEHENAMIHCVAHTGAFGTNNRTKEQVDRDWELLARSYPQICRQ